MVIGRGQVELHTHQVCAVLSRPWACHTFAGVVCLVCMLSTAPLVAASNGVVIQWIHRSDMGRLCSCHAVSGRCTLCSSRGRQTSSCVCLQVVLQAAVGSRPGSRKGAAVQAAGWLAGWLLSSRLHMCDGHLQRPSTNLTCYQDNCFPEHTDAGPATAAAPLPWSLCSLGGWVGNAGINSILVWRLVSFLLGL